MAVKFMGDSKSSPTPEGPKELRKRVKALDKSLASVHERLIQTERQIFDLERSYLEETHLYGNVLQGWDAYLTSQGKSMPGGKGAPLMRTGSKLKDATSVAGGAGNESKKASRGVEIEHRLFSLGSVTSPAFRPYSSKGEGKSSKSSSKYEATPGGGSTAGEKSSKLTSRDGVGNKRPRGGSKRDKDGDSKRKRR